MDRDFLKGVKIEAGEPPEPLPRFHVEAFPDGSFRVIDNASRPFREHIFCIPDWSDPKSVAEEFARLWNEDAKERRR